MNETSSAQVDDEPPQGMSGCMIAVVSALAATAVAIFLAIVGAIVGCLLCPPPQGGPHGLAGLAVIIWGFWGLVIGGVFGFGATLVVMIPTLIGFFRRA